MELKAYQRDCLLGALSGLLMLVGDLCLSVVPYTAGDSGLFAREAYLTGGFQTWRLPLLGRGETLAVIQAQYQRLMPSMLIAYAGMVLLILAGFYAVLTKKTVLPRYMAALHMLVWQLVLMLIPDVRQLLGAPLSTWDFVLSQGSGNAALCIWMLINAVWAGRQRRRGETV